jgi:hypothetical protein
MKLRGGTWTTDDVRETIALGLRGAGMSAKDIEPLIAANCDNIPIAPSAAVAALIIGAALYGTSKADVG